MKDPSSPCELLVYQGRKLVMKRGKGGYSQDMYSEEEYWDKEENKDMLATVMHKVPYMPILTVNFSASPYELERAKRKKDKKKAGKGPIKPKRQKRQKLADIPRGKDTTNILPSAEINALTLSIVMGRVHSMKHRFNITDYVYSTEPILRIDTDTDTEPLKYLDALRDIEDELIRYEPFQQKFSICVENKKQRKLKEAQERAEKIAAGENVTDKGRLYVNHSRPEETCEGTHVCHSGEKESRFTA